MEWGWGLVASAELKVRLSIAAELPTLRDMLKHFCKSSGLLRLQRSSVAAAIRIDNCALLRTLSTDWALFHPASSLPATDGNA